MSDIHDGLMVTDKAKFIVNIISENESEKRHSYYAEAETLVSASRITLTFKPKRGYKIRQIFIDSIETIV